MNDASRDRVMRLISREADSLNKALERADAERVAAKQGLEIAERYYGALALDLAILEDARKEL